jgi:hypothetical protein
MEVYMEAKMSIQSRKELLLRIQKRYQQADCATKSKMLDEFIAITGYRRKYAIHLLNQSEIEITTAEKSKQKQLKKRKYDEAIRQALLTLSHAANQICSKRLVPFIPDLLVALERFGHLSLPIDIRNRVLEISPATVDRLLKTEREEKMKGLSTTRPRSLLKKQIKIRTFNDWNDVVPGFLEGDLVAHCGDRVDGSFLNTLVLTDIASTWTEFFPLLRKSNADVIAALEIAQQVLPFLLIGLDTDNGSEFINYALLNFCKMHKITFTRSRAYKKNDQAHVEEKNGSIVRRLIGYDRYDGLDAYNALAELYAVLRLYVNFFQPSLKLISKKRDGAKVTKKYDKAKTPYQRLLFSEHVSAEAKEKLIKQYNNLDPLKLLKDLEKLQDNFWKHAWKTDRENVMSGADKVLNNSESTVTAEKVVAYDKRDPEDAEKIFSRSNCEEIVELAYCSDFLAGTTDSEEIILPVINSPSNADNECGDESNSAEIITVKTDKKIGNFDCDESSSIIGEQDSKIKNLEPDKQSTFTIRRYRHSNKPRKSLAPRTWRTRKDPFEHVWAKIKLRLELNPQCGAKALLDELMKEDPDKIQLDKLRTLQRRIADWRKQQIKINRQKIERRVIAPHEAINKYISLIAQAVTNG